MRTKESSTRIIFVRHGKTDFPLDRIYCDDREDPALNDLGLSQARRAADILSELDIAAIFSSPSLRAKTTAQIINEKHNLPVDYREDLVERRFGFWEGMYFDEIESRFPEEYLNWKKNNAAFKPEGGESVYDLDARLRPCVDSLIDLYKGRVIVVVSHVGPIRVMLAKSLGVSLVKYRWITIDYASHSIVDYGASQNNVICVNR